MLINSGLFPEKWKVCRKRIRGIRDLLYIDEHILKESKARRKYIAMAWIDNKKTYDIILQSWVIDCLKIYKISDEVMKLIEKIIKSLTVKPTAGGKT